MSPIFQVKCLCSLFTILQRKRSSCSSVGCVVGSFIIYQHLVDLDFSALWLQDLMTQRMLFSLSIFFATVLLLCQKPTTNVKAHYMRIANKGPMLAHIMCRLLPFQIMLSFNANNTHLHTIVYHHILCFEISAILLLKKAGGPSSILEDIWEVFN